MSSTLANGQEVSEYRIERVLGVGGFGVTYLATDLNLGLSVALKEYFPSDLAKRNDSGHIEATSSENQETFEWGLARFLDEARTLASFHHPNIVRVMRYFKANQSAYMVMEYVEGASLPEWVKPKRATGAITQNDICRLMLPLLDGLGVIHQAGYLHRDIKPGNIYVRADNTPVLLDFGAARKNNANSEMTALVSPGYAPVEQYSSESAQGPWSDLYSVGAVLYWLATGKKPVDAIARLRADPQLKAVDAADRTVFAEQFLRAIDWALSPKETDRPQSVAALASALGGKAHTGASDATRTLPAGNASDRNAALAMPATSLVDQPITWDPEALGAIQTELAQRIGPMASILIKRAATRHATADALIAAVSAEIEDEADRTTFSKQAKKHLGHTQPHSQPASSPTQVATVMAAARFELSVLEKAERRLAQYLGAISRVVVKKAALKARDESELYLLLADEIDEPTERRAFIRKAIATANRDN